MLQVGGKHLYYGHRIMKKKKHLMISTFTFFTIYVKISQYFNVVKLFLTFFFFTVKPPVLSYHCLCLYNPRRLHKHCTLEFCLQLLDKSIYLSNM